MARDLQQPGHIPLLIGADWSILVGTAQALMRVYAEGVRVLYVDGDIDGVAPQPDRCLSAAAMALWLSTQASPFRAGPTLRPSQVTVIGWTADLESAPLGLQSLPLAEVRRSGPGEAARQALHAIPASAPILLHFDIDVLNKQEMAAAYFPHADGLSIAEGRELLGALLADTRVRIIEVTEYASFRDLDQSAVARIVELLAAGLKRPGREVIGGWCPISGVDVLGGDAGGRVLRHASMGGIPAWDTMWKPEPFGARRL
jgi:arginase